MKEMLTQILLWQFITAVLIIILCASCSSETNNDTSTEEQQITKSSIQKIPASIKETSVPPKLYLIESPSLNKNNLVSFGFRSSKAGTISYSGSCFGSTRNAIRGDHHILFVTMVEGKYEDCAIQVTDSEGRTSDAL